MKKWISLFLVFAAFIIFISTSNILKANSTFQIQIENGASIRLTNPTSIRFKGSVSGEIEGNKITYGIVVVKGNINAALVTINRKDSIYDEVSELNPDGTFSISLTNLLVSDFATIFTARSYVKIDGIYYYSNTVIRRTIYDIALTAKNDNQDHNYLDYIINNCYNINYQLNGGNLPSKIKTLYTTQDSFNLPIPTKVGYTFEGWYLDSKFTEDKITEIKNHSTGDITLYAKWELEKVTYVLNGGSWTDLEIIKNGLSNIENEATVRVSKYIDDYWDSYEGNIFLSPVNQAVNAMYSTRLGLKDLGGIYQIIQIINNGIRGEAYLDSVDYALYWHATADKQIPSDLEVGNIIIFDQDITLLTSGDIDLNMSIYQEDNYHNIINQDTTLAVDYPYKLSHHIYKSGYNFVGWYEDINLTGSPVTTINNGITVYAKWESNIDEWANDLELIFENPIENSLNLPTIFGDYKLEWYSSNEVLLSNQGIYTRPYQDTQITMSVDLVSGSKVLDTATFTVDIKGYADLSQPFASGFLWGNLTSLTEEVFINLDVLYCAFIKVNSDGTIPTSSANNAFTNNLKNYVIEQAHAKGKWVVVSVTGVDGADANFEAIAASETARITLAENIVKLINQYHLDGVDIDWETPNTSTSTNFTLLMKEIYTKVKANNINHLVTADIGGGKWQPPKYDLNNSQQYMDYINVMTYGGASSYGYHQSALYKSTTKQPYNEYNNYYQKPSGSTSNGMTYTLTSCSVDESIAIFHNTYNVPYHKLAIGAAFYGIRQVTYTDADGRTYFKSDKSVGYSTILNEIASGNYDECFDEECKVPYLLAKDKQSFYSYDNPESIKYKCEYVKTNGLASTFFWASRWDYEDILIKALGSNIK